MDTATTGWPRDLVLWYQANARELPWRKDRDPYHVWISEIMLQQTRIEAVMGYYQRFMEAFPTVQDLAAADEETVLKAWEGLGYYSRARNLHKAAKSLTKAFNGRFPTEYETIRSLPGIGDYTAAAIASIAFGQPKAAVDGNVLRVFSRLYERREDVLKDSFRKSVRKELEALIPQDETASFTQGIMELGETVCLPANPRCEQCPLQESCLAFRHGTQQELPVRLAKKEKKEVRRAVIILRDPEGRVLLTRRPEKGVLAGLWEFPGIDLKSEDTNPPEKTAVLWEEAFGIRPESMAFVFSAEHTFTHIHWSMQVYEAKAPKNAPAEVPYLWAGPEEFSRAAIPSAFRKIREYVFASFTDL